MSIVLDGSNLTTTGVINSGTAVASTSGTSIDFTSIPAGVKRITVMFNGVSTNGTSHLLIQIGNSSVETSGYVGQTNATVGGSTTQGNTPTAGFGVIDGNAANALSGIATLATLGSNLWVYAATHAAPANTVVAVSGGTKTTTGVVDRIRITTVNGTDTFDAGSINILYE